MKILALETSTQVGSVAIIQDGKVLAQRSSDQGRSHSENIHPFIQECLDQTSLALSDLDIFAVGQGPGSFTGIRVAANVGKTFAYAYEKPLVTIDSLMLLAYAFKKSSKPVLSIINAHKNMVYLGFFDCSGPEPTYLKGPLAVPVRDLAALIQQNCWVIGDGWDAFESYFPSGLKSKMHRDLSFSDYPQASNLGFLAEARARQGQTLDWKSFIPLYIRASEAEETRKGILISPLK